MTKVLKIDLDRFIIKGKEIVNNEGATVVMTVALKLNSLIQSKSNQSLGGDDYFFALLTSLPTIYPAPPHNAIRAINASIDIVIICKVSFLKKRHNLPSM